MPDFSASSRRLDSAAVEASTDLLLRNGADPLLQSESNPRWDIPDWQGNSIDWAALSWNHTFLRAVLSRLDRGEAPLKEETEEPRDPLQPIKPTLGSRFVTESLRPFWRGTGAPRRIIISTGEAPFDHPASAGQYSWDFTGSRLVKSEATSATESASLPAHPTNDDIAQANIAEWERTFDALIEGGVVVKLLQELSPPGHFSIPARFALRLVDATNIDVTQDVPFPRSYRSNGGSLAACLIEAELCSAYSDTPALISGLVERGTDIRGARLLPKPYEDVPRIQAPVLHLVKAVADRACTQWAEEAKAKDDPSIISADQVAQQQHEIFKENMALHVPILALAVATLDPELIDYLVHKVGVSTQPPSTTTTQFKWADFLPRSQLEHIWSTTTSLCRHLLPGRPDLDSKLFNQFLARRSATVAKLEALGLE
ncbi:hypothetical protein V8E36_005158 [Tilletia maclaganii]